jgi:hypothetical protein
VRFSCEQVFDYLKKLSQVTVPLLSRELDIIAPTDKSALNHMKSLGIIEEMGNKQRNKVYTHRNYLKILEDDTEPLNL